MIKKNLTGNISSELGFTFSKYVDDHWPCFEHDAPPQRPPEVPSRWNFSYVSINKSYLRIEIFLKSNLSGLSKQGAQFKCNYYQEVTVLKQRLRSRLHQ